jgi:hypothetical protein
VNAELRRIPVAEPDDILRHLGETPRRPAILLSASVPYMRHEHADDEARNRNQRYVDMARPELIRLAVVELTKTALRRGAQLIFGAHPAISPMVLDAARNVGAPPGSILIFQSEFFADSIPNSTLELANWSAGCLFLTPRQPARGMEDARSRSLAVMRDLMVSPTNLRGAIFVGGMDGVEEEVKHLESVPRDRPLPCYAIASTGSAAELLFDQSPERFTGNRLDPDSLRRGRSYALLARQILDDMEIAEPRPD